MWVLNSFFAMHELGLGEFALDAYNEVDPSDKVSNASAMNLTFIYILFFFATLILMIVLMNMLIGIMSEILAEEREQS